MRPAPRAHASDPVTTGSRNPCATSSSSIASSSKVLRSGPPIPANSPRAAGLSTADTAPLPMRSGWATVIASRLPAADSRAIAVTVSSTARRGRYGATASHTQAVGRDGWCGVDASASASRSCDRSTGAKATASACGARSPSRPRLIRWTSARSTSTTRQSASTSSRHARVSNPAPTTTSCRHPSPIAAPTARSIASMRRAACPANPAVNALTAASAEGDDWTARRNASASRRWGPGRNLAASGSCRSRSPTARAAAMLVAVSDGSTTGPGQPRSTSAGPTSTA